MLIWFLVSNSYSIYGLKLKVSLFIKRVLLLNFAKLCQFISLPYKFVKACHLFDKNCFEKVMQWFDAFDPFLVGKRPYHVHKKPMNLYRGKIWNPLFVK